MTMAILSTFEMRHWAECGVYFMLVTFGVVLLFALIVLTSDYVDGWLRRRALGDIPFVDEGSNMSARLRWYSLRFDAEKEYAKAYKQYSKAGKPYATRVQSNDHGRFHGAMVNAIDKTLPLTIDNPTTGEWKQLNVFNTIVTLCSTVVMSVLLGQEFCMDISLIQAMSMYNATVMPSCYERTSYPRVLRPFVWRLSPPCRAMKSHFSKAKMRLMPEIKRRIDIARPNKGRIGNDGPASLLDGLIETAFEKGILNRSGNRQDDDQQVDLLAEEIILYHFELSSPIAFFVIFKLYAIIDHMEYLAPLREELHLPFIDLLCPIHHITTDVETRSLVTSFRRVMKPVHLESINLSLNPGTIIMSPGRDVHLDPDHYENPTTFDGYRFYDASRGTCTPHISTTSPTFLTFSHGISACPARVLATQISRTIFIMFLLKYDVELAHEEMPAYGITNGPVYLPNPLIMMRVRPRQKDALGP
ncbi:cytochrome P450 monooxygenase [Aspergillus nomiae NRRL 13137]|uniref:Cytochrome P450 monooxygenase n=1 Tax=Aspergillus nomiae NRRL (strain ATCC 15546 / NRRL 13137 / CBS 260.88 / M93) TaxID=1509407 RepID=A0A0L1J5Q0_ASPN3|nr:cytochrome P450 monooxygenase [Aspergillus nomiae NRRL 13137]KNG87151.1 cytochrome P450 monooxygenase [Aspergillus nomiae NRRL 13137]